MKLEDLLKIWCANTIRNDKKKTWDPIFENNGEAIDVTLGLTKRAREDEPISKFAKRQRWAWKDRLNCGLRLAKRKGDPLP